MGRVLVSLSVAVRPEVEMYVPRGRYDARSAVTFSALSEITPS